MFPCSEVWSDLGVVDGGPGRGSCRGGPSVSFCLSVESRAASAVVGGCGLDPLFLPRHHRVAAGGARHAETSVAEVCLHSTSSIPGAKVTPAQGQCPEQPLTRLLAAPAQVTTDLRQRCTDGHTGTSVSAPMVAGIIALALEAK